MRIGFDPDKSAKNAAERELEFELVADLDWAQAIVVEDERRDYGERGMRGVPLRQWQAACGGLHDARAGTMDHQLPAGARRRSEDFMSSEA